MLDSARFPFVEARDVYGDLDAVPSLPLILSYGDRPQMFFEVRQTRQSV